MWSKLHLFTFLANDLDEDIEVMLTKLGIMQKMQFNKQPFSLNMINFFLCHEVIFRNSFHGCILVYPTAWNIVSNFMLLSIILQWTFLAVNLCMSRVFFFLR